MPRVLVTPEIVQRRGDHVRLLKDAGLEIFSPAASVPLMQPSVLIENLAGVSAAVVGMEPFNPEVLAAARSLRVVARVGVGYDAVDVPAATAKNIAVTITPGTNEHSVAEQALSLVLGVYRGFPLRDQNVRRGQWVRQSLPRLAGKTLGLVGLGRIGKAIVPRAQGLGLKVIAYDPFPNEEFAAANNVWLCSFDELLAEADIVSLHLPATAETRDLINEKSLAKMKKTALLINTARGTLVDEDALFKALKSGKLWAAGLDVFKQEPLPKEHPLLTLDNVLVSPHTGGIDEESEFAMCTMAAQCVVELYEGRWPEGAVVNSEIRASWKW
jgi:D-3-phosphoglycerate dehydrogenase / 2-oxoglutarate reductase